MWSEMNNRRSHRLSWLREGQVEVVEVGAVEGVEQGWESTCWVWVVVVVDRNNHQEHPDYLRHRH